MQRSAFISQRRNWHRSVAAYTKQWCCQSNVAQISPNQLIMQLCIETELPRHFLCTYWRSIAGLLMCKLVCICAQCECVRVVVFWWGRGTSWVCVCVCVCDLLEGPELTCWPPRCLLLSPRHAATRVSTWLFMQRSKKRPGWGGNQSQQRFPRLLGWLIQV